MKSDTKRAGCLFGALICAVGGAYLGIQILDGGGGGPGGMIGVIVAVVVYGTLCFGWACWADSRVAINLQKAKDGDKDAMFKEAMDTWKKARDLVGDSDFHGNVNEIFNRALGWFERAAQQGQPEAAFFLGDLYESGIKVGMNIEQALEYYRIAAACGHLGAQRRIEILEKQRNNNRF